MTRRVRSAPFMSNVLDALQGQLIARRPKPAIADKPICAPSQTPDIPMMKNRTFSDIPMIGRYLAGVSKIALSIKRRMFRAASLSIDHNPPLLAQQLEHRQHTVVQSGWPWLRCETGFHVPS